MTSIKRTENADYDVEIFGRFMLCWWGCENGAATVESSMAVPHKINIELSGNSTPGYISKRTEKSGHVPCCLKSTITPAIIP